MSLLNDFEEGEGRRGREWRGGELGSGGEGRVKERMKEGRGGRVVEEETS